MKSLPLENDVASELPSLCIGNIGENTCPADPHRIVGFREASLREGTLRTLEALRDCEGQF